MCISGILAAAGSIVSTGAQVYQAREQRRAVQSSMIAAQQVESKAAQSANSRLAMRRRALKDQSLMTGGAAANVATTGIPTPQRGTLGGGG